MNNIYSCKSVRTMNAFNSQSNRQIETQITSSPTAFNARNEFFLAPCLFLSSFRQFCQWIFAESYILKFYFHLKSSTFTISPKKWRWKENQHSEKWIHRPTLIIYNTHSQGIYERYICDLHTAYSTASTSNLWMLTRSSSQ